jgi:hypothetical protein
LTYCHANHKDQRQEKYCSQSVCFGYFYWCFINAHQAHELIFISRPFVGGAAAQALSLRAAPSKAGKAGDWSLHHCSKATFLWKKTSVLSVLITGK